MFQVRQHQFGKNIVPTNYGWYTRMSSYGYAYNLVPKPPIKLSIITVLKYVGK